MWLALLGPGPARSRGAGSSWSTSISADCHRFAKPAMPRASLNSEVGNGPPRSPPSTPFLVESCCPRASLDSRLRRRATPDGEHTSLTGTFSCARRPAPTAAALWGLTNSRRGPLRAFCSAEPRSGPRGPDTSATIQRRTQALGECGLHVTDLGGIRRSLREAWAFAREARGLQSFGWPGGPFCFFDKTGPRGLNSCGRLGARAIHISDGDADTLGRRAANRSATPIFFCIIGAVSAGDRREELRCTGQRLRNSFRP